MNLAQRIVLLIAAVLLLATTVFPPWVFVYRLPNLPEAVRPAGYHVIFQDHTPQDPIALMKLFSIGWPVHMQFFTIRIDTNRLTVEIVGVLLLTILLYLALRATRV